MQRVSVESGPISEFVKLLQRLGYHYTVDILKSQDYGVPQYRRRRVLLAGKDGPIDIPLPTHGPGRPTSAFATVQEHIGDLPFIKAGETHPTVPNHRAAALSPLNMERIQNTPVGGGRNDWPDILKLACHKNYDGHTDVYGRMH